MKKTYLPVLMVAIIFLTYACETASTNEVAEQEPEIIEMITATQTADSQANMTTDQALQHLKDGNIRFVNNNLSARDFQAQIKATAEGQYPFASVVSCIDSRIPTEMVFDQGIGDIFNTRIAGNFVNEDILGSLEFASKVAGAKVLIVMGHTSCGAVKGACDGAELGNLTQMLAKIMPAVTSVETEEGADRSSKNSAFVNEVAEKNVMMTIDNIRSDSPVLKEMEDAGELVIVGAMYDVASGKVSFM